MLFSGINYTIILTVCQYAILRKCMIRCLLMPRWALYNKGSQLSDFMSGFILFWAFLMKLEKITGEFICFTPVNAARTDNGCPFSPVGDFLEIDYSPYFSSKFMVFLKKSKWMTLIDDVFRLHKLIVKNSDREMVSTFIPIEDFVKMIGEYGSNGKYLLKMSKKWQKYDPLCEVIIDFSE